MVRVQMSNHNTLFTYKFAKAFTNTNIPYRFPPKTHYEQLIPFTKVLSSQETQKPTSSAITTTPTVDN